MEQWTAQTRTAIESNSITSKNYTSVMNKTGGFDKWVRSLGGVFERQHGKTDKVKTVSEFQERDEYVHALMAIMHFCYWNGSTWWYWLNSASKSFYSSKQTKTCPTGTITQLCTGASGKTRITNCNYGTDTLAKQLGYSIWSCDYDKMISAGHKKITDKSQLRPGDLVHFFRGSIKKANWRHVAIVHAVENGQIWLSDFGKRFITTGKPLHAFPSEYSTYGNNWLAVRWLDLEDDTQKEEDMGIIHRNTNFRGFNTSTRTLKPQYIVIHYTGSEGTAADNVAYFNGGNRNASADIFVGHNGELMAYNNDIAGRYSWHCGGSIESAHHPFNGICTNPNSIGVELCTHYDGSKWTFTDKTVSAAVEVTKYLMKKFGIPADRVIRHYDVTGKACPRVPGWGAVGGDAAWQVFKKRIATDATTHLYRVRASWADVDSQKGAFTTLDNAIECAKQWNGYKVYDSAGKQVYPEEDEVKMPATIKRGARGAKVLIVQRICRTYYANGKKQTLRLDESFGAKTETAVKYWQSKHKDHEGNPLTQDGVVGAKTWRAMWESL